MGIYDALDGNMMDAFLAQRKNTEQPKKKEESKKDEKKTEAKKDTAAEGKTPEVNVDQHKPQPQPQPEAAPAV